MLLLTSCIDTQFKSGQECTDPVIAPAAAPVPITVVAGNNAFATGIGSELVQCLPAPLVIGPTFVLYSQLINGAQAGDFIDAYFDAEVTNNTDGYVMIAWYIEITDSTGRFVTRTSDHGTNISTDEHHFVLSDELFYTFTYTEDYTVAVYAYAAGAVEESGAIEYLNVEPDDGELNGYVNRP